MGAPLTNSHVQKRGPGVPGRNPTQRAQGTGIDHIMCSEGGFATGGSSSTLENSTEVGGEWGTHG